jgi:TIR domain
MLKIAISYRRADCSAIAGRIFDRLAAHFGEDAVFMDIDNIPLGTDFRIHIQEVLQRTNVLIALIGADWLGVGADGAARMNEKTDPVRVEIETALRRKTPIIPVLVDGAKMPDSTALPAEFGNFAFLNAAEVASGRDFRSQLARLIGAIEQIAAAGGSAESPHPPIETTSATVASIPVRKPWRADIVPYFVAPLVLMLAAHYVVLINNLNNDYLWLAATAIPFAFGFAQFWVGNSGGTPATLTALALGLIGASAMSVSESFISGDPILPQNRFEWRDNIQFAGAIALSLVAGYVLARALHVARHRWSASSSGPRAT